MIPGTFTSRDAGPERLANIGGPMSWRREEHIASTILGKDDGRVRCPRILRAGLLFEAGTDPVAVLGDVLAEEGYGSPEDLREDFGLPPGRLICRPGDDNIPRLRVASAPRRELLAQALLLGLCSNQIFDPARPVLWTGSRLTRAVELFDPAGFYA